MPDFSNIVPARVLVVTDVQRDFFCPEGFLYVKGGEVLPAKIAKIAPNYDAIIFTLDWHPANHCSFVKQGGPWPPHCVAYTQGAGLADDFTPVLANCRCELYFKGTHQDQEQYGAFGDLPAYSPIKRWLEGARYIDVCGIAGDYCVKETAAIVAKIASPSRVRLLKDLIVSIDGGAALDKFIAETGCLSA